MRYSRFTLPSCTAVPQLPIIFPVSTALPNVGDIRMHAKYRQELCRLAQIIFPSYKFEKWILRLCQRCTHGYMAIEAHWGICTGSPTSDRKIEACAFWPRVEILLTILKRAVATHATSKHPSRRATADRRLGTNHRKCLTAAGNWRWPLIRKCKKDAPIATPIQI